MKLFFGSSTSQFPKYKKYYYAIRDLLIEEGHVLTRDWIGIYREEFSHPKKTSAQPSFSWKQSSYEQVIDAVFEAELIILEDTVSSFSNGHIMTLALQRRIPVLVLWIAGEKKTYLKNKFIQGIHSDYLEISEYDLTNYKDIIRKFIKKYTNAKEKHRFHLVIDELERNYLDWAQYNKGESRTNVIRKALRDKINSDTDYQKYLTK